MCLRYIAVTNSGVVRTHGPIGSRCQGSGRQPRAPVSSPLTRGASSSQSPSASFSVLPESSSSRVTVPSQSQPSPFEAIPPLAVLKRIPRSARPLAASILGSILADIVEHPGSLVSWERLHRFSIRCLRVPPSSRTPKHKSLSSLVKQQLKAELDPTDVLPPKPRKAGSRSGHFAEEDVSQQLARRVSAKLEEGDFVGAVRLASSEEKLAAFSPETLSALKSKHPAPHPDSDIPPAPSPSVSAAVFPKSAVVRAIKSFPNGSAGGPDKLRPQHLKDILQATGEEESSFLDSLVSLCSLVLEGGVPAAVRPFFFGASLVALEKKDGGVRPIAVGWTLRRLVSKIAGYMVVDELADLLSPRQLGYGIKGGAEAIVHAGRKFLQSSASDHVLLKLDFRNAFNSIRRDKMLEAVRELAPDIYPLVHSAYATPSILRWNEEVILSSEGVQQGDPLGPPLFCLALHHHCAPLTSSFAVMYLDDVSLGGPVEDVLHDLEVVRDLENLGLVLNNRKSEIICKDVSIQDAMLLNLPGAKLVSPELASLLGSPLGDVSSIDLALEEKTEYLRHMGSRLKLLSAHDSLILLRHSLSIPKLQYLLRTAPCFLSSRLVDYDSILRSILGAVTNTPIDSNNDAWIQASLPVRLGGLGVRRACQIAPSAFLASSMASQDLVSAIIPSLHCLPTPAADSALSLWSQGHSFSPPQDEDAALQSKWDSVLTTLDASTLLTSALDDTDRARLLAVRSKASGAWLQALPVSSLGLRLDDSSLRIAVGLRLGTDICAPHLCRHCDSEVGPRGLHGLSCRYSEGRHSRHASVNDILHRALTAAKIPSRLEPSGLSSTDGSRPDGMTIVPWRSGRPLVWDATCPDTLAVSYRSRATCGAGRVAALAEEKKSDKFSHLSSQYHFVPVAIETFGAMGPAAASLIKELGSRGSHETGEEKFGLYLYQRLSMAVQRGNAASVIGSIPCSSAAA